MCVRKCTSLSLRACVCVWICRVYFLPLDQFFFCRLPLSFTPILCSCVAKSSCSWICVVVCTIMCMYCMRASERACASWYICECENIREKMAANVTVWLLSVRWNRVVCAVPISQYIVNSFSSLYLSQKKKITYIFLSLSQYSTRH